MWAKSNLILILLIEVRLCVRSSKVFISFFCVHECVLVVSIYSGSDCVIKRAYHICYGDGTGHNQTNMQKKNTHRLGKQKDAVNSASKDSVCLSFLCLVRMTVISSMSMTLGICSHFSGIAPVVSVVVRHHHETGHERVSRQRPTSIEICLEALTTPHEATFHCWVIRNETGFEPRTIKSKIYFIIRVRTVLNFCNSKIYM